ncbi:glycosyltransferase family 32 protein [Bremerella volcania]|uniref:glycosyltransferase family 32 protein n=1 Tax=Bremerella volcania TaxID=2527984 RepID=UPI0013FD0CBA|nr:glycosyltransferase [Bremerella volcania]
MPTLFDRFRNQFRDLHPDWDHRFWTEDDCQQLDCKALLNAWPNQASRSNAARLEILSRYGGVYVDTDVEPLKSFDPLLQVDAFAAEEYRGRVCNAVMGSVPQHPWVLWQLEALPRYKKKRPPWGPLLATEAYKEMVKQGVEVSLYPTTHFYPYLWNQLSLRGSNEYPKSYAVHHWAISWNPRIAWETSK